MRNDAALDYRGFYDYQDPRFLEWPRLGAAGKAANIIRVCQALPQQLATVLDVGCGTGAVAEALKQMEFGRSAEWTGFDVDSSQAELLRAAGLYRAVVIRNDLADAAFQDKQFDLVVCSHVLEHLVRPQDLLQEMLRIGKSVCCEVPLEDRWWRRKPTASVGHVQCWNAATFERFLKSCGATPIRNVVRGAGLRVRTFQGGLTAAKGTLSYLVQRVIPPRLASRLFVLHMCSLITRP